MVRQGSVKDLSLITNSDHAHKAGGPVNIQSSRIARIGRTEPPADLISDLTDIVMSDCVCAKCGAHEPYMHCYPVIRKRMIERLTEFARGLR